MTSFSFITVCVALMLPSVEGFRAVTSKTLRRHNKMCVLEKDKTRCAQTEGCEWGYEHARCQRVKGTMEGGNGAARGAYVLRKEVSSGSQSSSVNAARGADVLVNVPVPASESDSDSASDSNSGNPFVAKFDSMKDSLESLASDSTNTTKVPRWTLYIAAGVVFCLLLIICYLSYSLCTKRPTVVQKKSFDMC